MLDRFRMTKGFGVHTFRMINKQGVGVSLRPNSTSDWRLKRYQLIPHPRFASDSWFSLGKRIGFLTAVRVKRPETMPVWFSHSEYRAVIGTVGGCTPDHVFADETTGFGLPSDF